MSAAQRLSAGFGAGLVAGFAMNLFARGVLAVNGGREARGAAPGGDRVGRGAQPPQARGTTEEDAAIRVGATAYRAVTRRRPDRRLRRQLGTAAHYLFSGAVGSCYAIAAERIPALRSGSGTLYGALVWVIADEGVMPALGLSRGPRALPPAVHMYALAAHCIYGCVLDASTRVLLNRRSSGSALFPEGAVDLS
jgi:hypothetical protein